MKKLFFILSLFTATVLTNQVVKPMELAQVFFIDNFYTRTPYFQCHCCNRTTNTSMVQMLYQIKSPNDTLYPLTPDDEIDNTFITITFMQGEGTTTNVTCFLTNNTVKNARPTPISRLKTKVIKYRYLYEFRWFHETSPFFISTLQETIKDLIDMTLNAYFRKFLLNKKKCIFCSNKIKAQEMVVLLRCGNGTHNNCYIKNTCKFDTNLHCPKCANKISEDCWNVLEALPAGI